MAKKLLAQKTALAGAFRGVDSFNFVDLKGVDVLA